MRQPRAMIEPNLRVAKQRYRCYDCLSRIDAGELYYPVAPSELVCGDCMGARKRKRGR